MTGSPNEKPATFDLNSDDVAARKRAELKRLFPEVFDEDKIDFDQLRRVMGDWVDEGTERFGLTWPGKAACMKVIQAPATGALRPDRTESVNFDESENVFIEGDNLEALKLLQKAYFGKIRIIYIDPPYNTGNEFIYPDKYSESLETYLSYTGQTDSEGKKFSTNSDAAGRFHSRWMNMMYPRLYLAKNLLKEDGIIFISIGDNEQDNLKKLCNEIFGEENFVSQVPRVAKRTSNKGTHFRPTKDYVLVYCKDITVLDGFGIDKTVSEGDYKLSDADGRSYKQSGASLYQPSLDSRPNQRYYIEAPDGSLIIPPGNVFPSEKSDGAKVRPVSNADKVWRWSVETYLKKKDQLIFTKGSAKNPLLNENGGQSKWNIYPKVYRDEDEESSLLPEDIIYDYPNSQGTKELLSLDIPFSFSKPSGLIKHLITLTRSDKELTILDFFAGSGTTAHAVMKLNAEDGGRRKFISIQLPEPTDEESDERKAGYHTIADISKERIRRAAKKIRQESEWQLELGASGSLDLGFKVFKLTRSAFALWDATSEVGVDDLITRIDAHSRQIVRVDDEDILFELLLKDGFDLSTTIEEVSVAGSKAYSVADGSLLICLEHNLTKEVLDALAALAEETHVARVVCLDAGFQGNDQLKTNAVQTFKSRLGEGEDGSMFRTV